MDSLPLPLNREQRKLYNTVVNQYSQEPALDTPLPRQLLLNVDGVAGPGKTFALLKTCVRIQELGLKLQWIMVTIIHEHSSLTYKLNKFHYDVVEYLLSAIWIDSGSFNVCREVVERMGILPYLRRILKDSVQVWHSKEDISVLASTETVKYIITAETVKEGGDEGREYLCKLFVRNWRLWRSTEGLREEVKTKAAERAIGGEN